MAESAPVGVDGGVHQVAAQGVAGASAPLPHLDTIQRAFGRHDVTGVAAQVGGAAQTATGALGAEAYAMGNQVGFAGSPSLHTAAHEAAHVVQQRAGVHLKGGISAAGDPYERHADAVADLVVQGKSAEGLLDQYGGGGGGGAAVQAKGGKLDETQVLPRFRTAPNQRATVLEKLQQVDDERDVDGNSKKKIALENAIASWVVTHQESFAAPVKHLSAEIKKYLTLREQHIEIQVATSLQALTPEATTYGRLAGDASYPEQLADVLNGAGSVHEHLLVQQMFVDKIYNQDADRIIAELTEQFSGVVPAPLEKNALKPPDGAIDVGEGTMTYENAHNNARSAARSMNTVPKVKNGGLGPHDPETHEEGTMIRGTDKFTAVETNAFTQSARLLFDMPVSGTGLSGSATDLFTCARLLNMTDPATKADFALAAFSFFAKAGAHTFHEVMLMARSAGFGQYVPGNYISAIPAARRVQLRSDLEAHAALLGDPVGGDAPVHAPDGNLHGWKDTLTLDGDAETWGPKVQAFLATRFGVALGAVTITPITDGRSGDAVYRVVVAREDPGPFKGIFKVFNDADMADTELTIGDQMHAKGVNTPSNKGMARVETGEGPSKAGVLFDYAEGETPHSLVKRIGAMNKDAEGRPALVDQLERAVIAVAKQLSLLHGKSATETGKVRRVEGPGAMKNTDAMDAGVKNLHEKGLYEIHRDAGLKAAKLTELEGQEITTAFDVLVQDNLVKQKLRKSMTHGDANAANFLVDGDTASVIDVNTASQSFGPKGVIKTGAADTGRFLETLRTSSLGALTPEEYQRLDDAFHSAYMPGSADQNLEAPKPNERDALKKIDDEKAADEKAEVYYRACWILNQISHAPTTERLHANKARLIELVPALAGKLVTE